MRALRSAATVAAFAALLFGTVLVFETFDRASHSASDTLRPFIITMAPVWAVAIAGAWAVAIAGAWAVAIAGAWALLRMPPQRTDAR